MTDTEKQKPAQGNKSTTGQKPAVADTEPTEPGTVPEQPEEVGGPKGLEPTRYGDWERKGILSDF